MKTYPELLLFPHPPHCRQNVSHARQMLVSKARNLWFVTERDTGQKISALVSIGGPYCLDDHRHCHLSRSGHVLKEYPQGASPQPWNRI